MSEINWKPLTIETYQSWVTACLEEAQDRMTDWEVTFVNSLDDQLGRGKNLTYRQAEILERIYANKTRVN